MSLRLRRLGRRAVVIAAFVLVPASLAGAKGHPSSGGSGLGSGSRLVDNSGHHYHGGSEHMGDRILGRGLHGHDVCVLQNFLTLAGYRTPVTGNFGSLTEQHVRAFQRAHRMRVTGIVTWAVSQRLRAVVSARVGAGRVPRAHISHGLAVAPPGAPRVIQKLIAAANRIAFRPYVYGGGHGSFNSRGYDCSGSVSYALHGGGLLSSPLDSSSFESYGRAGHGRWITIWTNSGHAYMYVAGLRFDTSAQGQTGGSRWSGAGRSNAGFIPRHPAGW